MVMSEGTHRWISRALSTLPDWEKLAQIIAKKP